MGRMERDKGARFEREIAELLGTSRVSVQGKLDQEHADVRHPTLYVQCKRRARLAIQQWWDETEAGAKASGKAPVLFVRQDRSDALVVIRAHDYLQLIGGDRC